MDVGLTYLSVAGVLVIVSAIKDREKTLQAIKVSARNALVVFPVLFLVFILMGVIQAYVSRDYISAALGSGGGYASILVGEVIGSVALIMPAAVFPFSGFLVESGAGYGPVVAFVMSSILVGISTIPLEVSVFGKKFTAIRNLLTLLSIFLLGVVFTVIL